MASIDRRLAELEAKLPGPRTLEILLKLMPSYDVMEDDVREFLGELGSRQQTLAVIQDPRITSPVDRGLAYLLLCDLMDVGKVRFWSLCACAPDELEPLRGRIHDRVITAVYYSVRNYSGADERIRQLAVA